MDDKTLAEWNIPYGLISIGTNEKWETYEIEQASLEKRTLEQITVCAEIFTEW